MFRRPTHIFNQLKDEGKKMRKIRTVMIKGLDAVVTDTTVRDGRWPTCRAGKQKNTCKNDKYSTI